MDDPTADEVLVRIEAVGMCHADLAVRAGDFPFPLPGVAGHEGAGHVEAVGAGVTSVRPGDRVMLTFDSCGRCVSCVRVRRPVALPGVRGVHLHERCAP
jgi:aryl-alcohol dehydrogenase